MCIGPAHFDALLIQRFVSGRGARLHRSLLSGYFRYLRVSRVVLHPDPAELATCRVDVCDCRLLARQCEHPLDLCYKLERRTEASSSDLSITLAERSEEAAMTGLVRLHVTTLGKRIEYCHCCSCCCQALTVARTVGTGYLIPSGYVPETSLACIRCESCAGRCPVGARPRGKADPSRCLGCGVCAQACRRHAITMQPEPVQVAALRPKPAPSLPPWLLQVTAFLLLSYVSLWRRWAVGREGLPRT